MGNGSVKEYSVKITSFFSIAHSLNDPIFGKAQKVHGATYELEAEFFSTQLNEHNVVLDMDLCTKMIQDILNELNYNNLDEMDQFAGKLTTTEFLAEYIYSRLQEQYGDEIRRINPWIKSIKITLKENQLLSASFQGSLS